MAELQSQQSLQELRIARARRRTFAKRLLIAGAAVAVIGGGAYWISARSPSGPLPGREFADQGQQHVEMGTPFDYNSNPPTSGPHYREPAAWGVYRDPVHDQILIHNLEHGGVWISYRPGIPDAVRDELESMVERYGTKVIVTPRAENESDIALAVWTRLDSFSVGEYRIERVEDFITSLRNRTAPEWMAM